MKRFLSASAVFALLVASVANAEDPKPAQPEQPPAKAVGGFGKAAQPGEKGTNPFGTATARTTAAKVALYEEEVETLEANREVRKAFVRAADVGIKFAEVNASRVEKIVAANGASKEELDKARLEIEAAKAQFEIRAAEMKEVEVKIKFAKKRLDNLWPENP